MNIGRWRHQGCCELRRACAGRGCWAARLHVPLFPPVHARASTSPFVSRLQLAIAQRLGGAPAPAFHAHLLPPSPVQLCGTRWRTSSSRQGRQPARQRSNACTWSPVSHACVQHTCARCAEGVVGAPVVGPAVLLSIANNTMQTADNSALCVCVHAAQNVLARTRGLRSV